MCLLRQTVCASANRPGLNRATDWLDWLVDALPWNPSSTSRLIPTPGTFKCPLRRSEKSARSSQASVYTTGQKSDVGRHRALPEVGTDSAWGNSTNRRRCSMKWNFLGALMMSIALASPSFATCGLLDKMLGGGCGCCGEASCSCCEKSCCCEEASCGCEDSCCSSCGCGGGGCCVLDRLMGCLGGHGGCGCCEASCCAEESSCCCEEASCGCEDSCCSSCGCKKGCGLLDGLCGMFKCNRGCGCCESSCCCEEASCCCEASCGCSSNCGCNGGDDAAPAEEAAPEENASARMVPPLPMADPNASVGQQRDVVRTSFTR